MRTLLATAVLLALAGTANAQVTGTTRSHSNSVASSGSTASPYTNLSITGNTPSSTTLRTAPEVIAPSNPVAWSPLSCVNNASGGLSVVAVGMTGGGPVDGAHCDGRADVASAGQVAATIGQLGANGVMDRARSQDLATRLMLATIDATCRQSAVMYAALRNQGLCSAIDWDGDAARYHAPTNQRVVVRGNAQARWPVGVDGSLGG